MVVIDQRVAFMGGLDIGYGRYDSRRHLLTNPKGDLWPGVDFCNYRTVDIMNPQEYEICSIDPSKDARMPWHDIGVRLSGASVQDLCRHFIQYWNYVNFQMDMDDRELLMYVGMSQQEIHTAEKEEEARKQASEEIIEHRKSIRLSKT
jgi:phospholipase D1/2